MKKYAVVGNPIGHSLSPSIHSIFAKTASIDLEYHAIEAHRENFEASILRLFEDGYEGLNITLPFKELAYEISQVRSNLSLETQSINTLWKEGDSLCGDSTDGKGLINDFRAKGLEIKNKKLVIIGAGGSAKAILPCVLDLCPSEIRIINRTKDKAKALSSKINLPNVSVSYSDLETAIDIEIDGVINTSSAGTLNEKILLPENLFYSSPWTYNLNYSESAKSFNNKALNEGSKTVHDGLGMLFHQAALSFEIWTGIKPDVDEAIRILRG